MSEREPFLLVDKYRPKKVADCILPKAVKATFVGYVERKAFPNLILAGQPGCGKTTVARALGTELGYETLFLNASREGNIDTVRTKIQGFASTVSLIGAPLKLVILDEADGITKAAQEALRGSIEEFSNNCRFIMTANFKHKMLDAMDSRTNLIEFKFPKGELPTLAAETMRMLETILTEEGRTYERPALAELIKRFFPNVRKILNVLDGHVGHVDAGIVSQLSDASMKKLFGFLAAKDLRSARTWYVENSDIDAATMFRTMYEVVNNHVDPKSIPEFVLLTGDYMFKSSMVVDQEINMMCYFIELMRDIAFKV